MCASLLLSRYLNTFLLKRYAVSKLLLLLLLLPVITGVGLVYRIFDVGVAVAPSFVFLGDVRLCLLWQVMCTPFFSAWICNPPIKWNGSFTVSKWNGWNQI